MTDAAKPPRATVDVATLTTAIAAGDAQAFEAFYRAWFGRVVGMVRTSTRRDEAFCLDVVQDTMVRVIRKIPPLETEAALAAWLGRTAARCARDRLRAELRRARRERASIERGRAAATDRGPSASGAAVDELRAALARLEPSQSELLVARFGRGWTLARIGAACGLGSGAVDGRLGRLVRQLKGTLDEHDT